MALRWPDVSATGQKTCLLMWRSAIDLSKRSTGIKYPLQKNGAAKIMTEDDSWKGAGYVYSAEQP